MTTIDTAIERPRLVDPTPVKEPTLALWALAVACLVAAIGVVAIGLGLIWMWQGLGPDRTFRAAHLPFFGAISIGVGAFPLFGAVGYLIVRNREWFTWMLILTLPLIAVVALVLLT
ncbi:MAG: hypothetical protein Q4G64_03625 [bacterium]|nr:hypothetical protein [bacterium]